MKKMLRIAAALAALLAMTNEGSLYGKKPTKGVE